jgi:tetratricopeptide (TPR) repeat protein
LESKASALGVFWSPERVRPFEVLCVTSVNKPITIKTMKKKAKKKHETITTSDFTISLADTKQTNPAAADLLHLCAFLCPENIPEEILKEGIKDLEGHFERIYNEATAYDETLKAAYHTKFLRYNPDRKMMTMNSSIQELLRKSLSKTEQRIWAEKAVRAVNNVFPKVEFASWSQCQRLLKCAKNCAEWVIKWDLMFEEAANLLTVTANYLHENGQYAHARPLYEQALIIRVEVLGTTDLKVAESLNDLASLYHIQGKYPQAKPLYERAVTIVEILLNEEHPDTKELHKRRATSFNNLGSLHKAQKKFEEAKPYYEKSLKILEEVLCEKSANLAATVNNFAGLYEAQGEYDTAKPMYERALDIWNQVGDNHPNVSATINNLGGLYKAMGEDDKVKPLLEQALAIRKQALGEDHPDVAISLNNLAEFYKSIGDYAQAKPMYERALKILKETFDSNHPHLSMCSKNYKHIRYLMKQSKSKKRQSKRRK